MHELQPHVLRAVAGRDREWALLSGFLADPSPAMRLGVVSGRRHHGKSYLLRALCEFVGGLHITAISQEGRHPALRRFSDAIAAQAGLEPGTPEPAGLARGADHCSGGSRPAAPQFHC